jgi:hypothetical protein
VVGGGAVAIRQRTQPPEIEVPSIAIAQHGVTSDPKQQRVVHDEVPPIPDEVVVAPPIDAGARAGSAVAVLVDAGAPMVAVKLPTQVLVSPSKRSEYRFGDEPWQPVPESGVISTALDADTMLHVRNRCCQQEDRVVKPGATAQTASIALTLMPGHLKPTCDVRDFEKIHVAINNSPATLGESVTIPFDNTTDTVKSIKVEFLNSEYIVTGPIVQRVSPGEDVEVKCRVR